MNQLKYEAQATMNSQTNLHFSDFFSAIPEACSIYDKYQVGYTDEHSKWLGRWVKRAERYSAQTRSELDNIKQEVTDKLINKLVTQILVSPYDRAPFFPKTEKRPVLFHGLLFPYWMLEDILKLVGNSDGLCLAKPHDFMNEMIEWWKSLEQHSQSLPSKSTALIPLAAKTLVHLNQTVEPPHLDSSLLVSFNFSEHPELTMIKLFTYRDLVINAFKEMEIRKKHKGLKKQLKQIIRFGNEQKALTEKQKIHNAKERITDEETISKQFEDLSLTQKLTQDIIKGHFQDLMYQMNQAEERMKKVQQECKNKEAQIQAIQTAQTKLNS